MSVTNSLFHTVRRRILFEGLKNILLSLEIFWNWFGKIVERRKLINLAMKFAAFTLAWSEILLTLLRNGVLIWL